jgi:hypothetical protein
MPRRQASEPPVFPALGVAPARQEQLCPPTRRACAVNVFGIEYRVITRIEALWRWASRTVFDSESPGSNPSQVLLDDLIVPRAACETLPQSLSSP